MLQYYVQIMNHWCHGEKSMLNHISSVTSSWSTAHLCPAHWFSSDRFQPIPPSRTDVSLLFLVLCTLSSSAWCFHCPSRHVHPNTLHRHVAIPSSLPSSLSSSAKTSSAGPPWMLLPFMDQQISGPAHLQVKPMQSNIDQLIKASPAATAYWQYCNITLQLSLFVNCWCTSHKTCFWRLPNISQLSRLVLPLGMIVS